MAPASLVIMFARNRKLRIAIGLIFWTSLAVAQNASAQYEAVSQRSGNQLDLAGSAIANSFEPPPEFYRGPGSGGGGLENNTPISSSGHPSLGSVGESLSDTYNRWRAGGANLQDRISVGESLETNNQKNSLNSTTN